MAKHSIAHRDECPVAPNTNARDAGSSACPTIFPAPPRLVFSASPRVAPVSEASQDSGLPGLVGNSTAMRRLTAAALGLADAGHPILISGRAGSGKSALARALHRVSRRRGGELRIVRCTAFPECPSVEEHGRPGRDHGFADTIDTGTLILDEIADLSFAAQTGLLHWLRSIEGPLNLIALTHTPIHRAVTEGRFRSDLLHCLSAGHLVLPDLGEREDDVRSLAEHFRERLKATNRRVAGFSEGAREAMQRHSWPGNVRELRNRIERAMLIARDTLISPDDLGLPVPRA